MARKKRKKSGETASPSIRASAYLCLRGFKSSKARTREGDVVPASKLTDDEVEYLLNRGVIEPHEGRAPKPEPQPEPEPKLTVSDSAVSGNDADDSDPHTLLDDQEVSDDAL